MCLPDSLHFIFLRNMEIICCASETGGSFSSHIGEGPDSSTVGLNVRSSKTILKNISSRGAGRGSFISIKYSPFISDFPHHPDSAVWCKALWQTLSSREGLLLGHVLYPAL